MNPDTPWPPQVDEPLPRAAEAYAEPQKLAWLLSDHGHGREWARVLHVDENDTLLFWHALLQSAIGASIYKVNNREPHGIGCAIETTITVGQRTTGARIAWHYKHAHDTPRLVTAYPIG